MRCGGRYANERKYLGVARGAHFSVLFVVLRSKSENCPSVRSYIPGQSASVPLQLAQVMLYFTLNYRTVLNVTNLNNRNRDLVSYSLEITRFIIKER